MFMQGSKYRSFGRSLSVTPKALKFYEMGPRLKSVMQFPYCLNVVSCLEGVGGTGSGR